MKRLHTTRGGAHRKPPFASDLYPEIGKGYMNRAIDPEYLANKHKVDVRKVLNEAN